MEVSGGLIPSAVSRRASLSELEDAAYNCGRFVVFQYPGFKCAFADRDNTHPNALGSNRHGICTDIHTI